VNNDAATLNLIDLPSVAVKDRKEMPNCSAIYFVLDKDNVAIYVGQSIGLAQRWVQHHRLKQLATMGDCRIAWLEVSDTALLDSIERACIAYFQPSLNGTGGSFRVAKEGEQWIQVRIPDEAKELLDAWAKRHDRSASYIMRRLLLRALDASEHEEGIP